MGAPKKYTKKELKNAVDKYFASISFLKEVKDENGNPILDEEYKPLTVLTYTEPPGKAALALYLGIDVRTWRRWSSEKQFADICGYANTRIEAFLEREAVVRDNARGVIFNLQSNYWKQTTEISLEESTREALKEVPMSEKLAVIMAAAQRIPRDEDE